MLEIMKEQDIVALYGDLINNFRMSNRWLYAFMKRRNLSLRRRTKIGQKLPKQTEELLENFHQFVFRLRIEKSYEMCNIFNMDETPVWFDMAGNFTVNQTGEKTVHIRGTGNDKNRFTVVLTCAAGKSYCIYKFFKKSIFFLIFLPFFYIDGSKLPPICIFKGKRLNRGEQIPTDVEVWFQDNGWMNKNLMIKYINLWHQQYLFMIPFEVT